MISISAILDAQSSSTANVIGICTALGTFLLAIAAFWSIWALRQQAQKDRQYNQQLAQESWERSQELASQDRQHQSRPIVVPVGEFTPPPVPLRSDDFHSTDGRVNWGFQDSVTLPLQNMGGGVALNVHCILYGSEPPHNLQFVSWDNGPIGTGGNPVPVIFEHPQGLWLNPSDSIDGSHSLFDTSLDSLSNPAKDRIACLTITYHDLFGNKHMSIFNYTLEHRWLFVTIDKDPSLNGKPSLDLKELNDQKGQPSSKAPDLATVTS